MIGDYSVPPWNPHWTRALPLETQAQLASGPLSNHSGAVLKESSAVAKLYRHDIGKLYAIEREADALELTPDERLRFRQQKCPAILARMKARLFGWRDRYSEASSMAEALSYLENQWAPLGRFLDYALIPLDNNRCYAARGITSEMPLPGLCRGREDPIRHASSRMPTFPPRRGIIQEAALSMREVNQAS